MDFVKQCPNTYKSRISRFRINNCSTLDSYHCLKTEDNGLREICISPIWMEGKMCPIYSRGGEIVASKCFVQPKLECPTIVYKSSDVFNYTGCLPIIRENSTTKNTHQDMYNSTFTCINGAGVNLQAAYFAVPALLLFLMLIGNIVLWKSKHIRKRIRCLGDDTQIDQPEIVTPSFHNVSAEKTKDPNPSNENIHAENQSLLHTDNSPKEQQNNKPAKKEIIRPENEKTSKADACRKISMVFGNVEMISIRYRQNHQKAILNSVQNMDPTPTSHFVLEN
ncbi:uncharacterized protein [Magallana gigas]|uniref:uncharacterized protein n=1 Tax=Magallana gigas TaxID=29159 RepID=UPI0033408F02